KGKGRPQPHNYVTNWPMFQPAPAPDWMHVDALNIKGNGNGKGRGKDCGKPTPGSAQQQKLNPQQVQYLKQIGACFKCYQPGHTAKYCPLNRTIPVAATTLAMPINPLYQAYPAMP